MRNSDDVIAGLYEAASNEKPWPVALNSLAVYLRCAVVQLLAVDLQQGAMIYSFEGGDGVNRPVEAALAYTCKYHRIDPHLAVVMAQEPGVIFHSHLAMDEKSALMHPFYREFLLPFGMRYVHGGKVFQNESTAVVLGLHRGPATGPLAGDDLLEAERMFLHMGRAAAIYTHNQPAQAEAAVGRETLSRLNSPVVLIDEQRRIRSCNEMAERILDRGDVLINYKGALWCKDISINEMLTVAVRNLNLPGSDWRYVDPVERAVVRIPMQDHALPMSLCLLALRPESTLGAFGRQALAMALIHDPRERRPLDPFMLSAAFDLTPAEARVASLLGEGRLPKEVARELGSSVNTVRTQIRSIYHKLGVNHAGHLVATLHSSPLAAFTHGRRQLRLPH